MADSSKPPPHAAKPSRSAATTLLQKLTRRSTKVEPAAQPTPAEATTETNHLGNGHLVRPFAHTAAPSSSSSPSTSASSTAQRVQHTPSATATAMASSSAHSSPINHYRQSYVRRHSSTQNLSTIVRDESATVADAAAASPLRKHAGGIRKKTARALNNRFSHQFTLCCSMTGDDRASMSTPPVSVRYNSLAPAADAAPTASTATATTTTSENCAIGGSRSAGTSSSATCSTSTTVVTVHRGQSNDEDDDAGVTGDDCGGRLSPPPDAGGGGEDTRPRPTTATAPTPRNASTEPNTPAKHASPQSRRLRLHRSPTTISPPMPIRNPRHQHFLANAPPQPASNAFAEFPAATSSIAMSACRSRLRQKLLPPGGGSLDLPSSTSGGATRTSTSSSQRATQQHFSSPDIVLGSSGGQSRLRRLLADDGDDVEQGAVGQMAAAAVDGEGDGDVDDDGDEMAATEENVAANRSLSYDVLTGVRRPVSADSLAKQSLIAAQLLNLIPAERARERNFMAGRLAVNSLFGAGELDRVLPARSVKIYVCTWNMNGQHPPKTMTDFVLPHSIEFVPDVVVVGTQESCSLRFEWEVSLQETLGPSHVLLHAATLGTLHLAVFIRRDLIWFCSVPEDASLSVRPGTAFRTKGAVAISFALFGTSMLFVTSHLTAHQQKVKERVQDVKRIIHSLDLPRNLNVRNKSRDVTQNFDNVFWCGDLNFRLGEPRETVLKWIESTKFPLPAHLPNGYMHTDQLRTVLSNGAAFKEFREANITFPPTYKYDPGTQHFDTSSKQRAPAYTDRILYKRKSLPTGVRRGSHLANMLVGSGGSQAAHQQQQQQLECLAYDSVPSIVTSDHKPVWALFSSSVRPGLDSVPLAAGLFNREVYLEGMKRRLNNSNADSSTVCSIQ